MSLSWSATKHSFSESASHDTIATLKILKYRFAMWTLSAGRPQMQITLWSQRQVKPQIQLAHYRVSKNSMLILVKTKLLMRRSVRRGFLSCTTTRHGIEPGRQSQVHTHLQHRYPKLILEKMNDSTPRRRRIRNRQTPAVSSEVHTFNSTLKHAPFCRGLKNSVLDLHNAKCWHRHWHCRNTHPTQGSNALSRSYA